MKALDLRRPLLWLLIAFSFTFPAMSRAQDRVPPAVRDLLRVPVKQTPKSEKIALVIGVADYNDPIPDLKSAVLDAHSFSKFLQNQWGFGPDTIVEMTDDAPEAHLKPTRANIKAQVESLIKRLEPKSDVVVFYSGHGVNHGDKDFIVPADGNAENIDGSCVSATDLINALQVRKPRRALVFLDSCRNIGDGKRAAPARTPREEAARALEPQLAVLYSCEPGERSREGKPEHFRQGVFTRYLLEALSGSRDAAGPDGTVTFDSLREYIRGKVHEYVTNEYGDAQRPYGLASYGSMVLADAPRPLVAMSDDVERLVTASFQALVAGKYDEARIAAEEALRLNKSSAPVRALLGSIYLKLGRNDDAIRESQEALRLASDNALAQDTLKAALKGVPDKGDPKSFVAEAEALLNEGKLKEAEARLRQGLAAGGAPAADLSQAHFLLARVYEKQGMLDLALREYDETLRVDPSHRDASTGKSDLLKKKGDADTYGLVNQAIQLVDENKIAEAEFLAREVIAREPMNARAHYVMGRVYGFQKRTELALLEYDLALKSDPTLVDARNWRAKALGDGGQSEIITLAAEAFDLAKGGRLEDAVVKARKVLEMGTDNNSANAKAHLVLGLAAEKQQQPGTALKEFQEAIRLDSTLVEAGQGQQRLAGMQKPADLKQLAAEVLRLAQAPDPSGAEEKARALLASDPNNPAARYALGRLFDSRKDYEAARREYNAALQADPNLEPAKQALALTQISINAGDSVRLVEEAQRHLLLAELSPAADRARRAVLLDAKNARAHAVLGNVLLYLDKPSEGMEEIRKAAELDPSQPLTFVGQGVMSYQEGYNSYKEYVLLLNAGKTKDAKRKLDQARPAFDKAAKQFQRAIQLDEKNILAHVNLGAAFQRLDKLDEAEREYKRVLELDTKSAVGHYNLASNFMERYLASGEKQTEFLKLAEAEYRLAITLAPNNARFYAELAGSLFLQKREDEAKKLAEEARSRGRTDHWVYEKLGLK